MPRHKKLYSLTKIGKYYYYRCYDERGRRTAAKSTGLTNKDDAETHCAKLYKAGRLVPRKTETLSQWVNHAHWWDYEKCAYIRGRLERSTVDRPAIGPRYANDALRKLENHILPVFGNVKLEAITASAIEDWMMDLRQKWTRATVNGAASVLRTMLTEARRLDLIAENPFDRVRPLMVDDKPRGILTISEARAVLDPTRWSNPIYHAVNLVAAFTAMRQGEILAVRTSTLFPDHIYVDKSWHLKYGLGPTKGKRARAIPLPRQVHEVIDKFLAWDGFVFSLTNGQRPVTGNRVTEMLYGVLESFDRERDGFSVDRKARNITFHSWRHWSNTFLRNSGVPDAELKAVTGHRTDAMTERYTHFRPQDYRAVIAAQDRLLVDAGERWRKPT